MLDFLFQYGLFFAKTFTLIFGVILLVAFIASITQKNKREEGTIEIKNMNDKLDNLRHVFEEETLDKAERKKLKKARKKEAKEKKKAEESQPRLFVVRFEGDISASEGEALREIITALLCTVKEDDEVLVILDSGGGFVHQYGLAASQLQRLRQKNINLTVAIDKVAASGGYLMACVANKIIAAPFAIVGSIGVIGQVPNFHRLLTKNNIDFEQHTAGKYKRTLTMFGKNTSEARHKFIEDIEKTHDMFKAYIEENRPQVNIEEVATGEHWHAIEAQHYNLVDTLITSDDYIVSHHPQSKIYEVSYYTKQPIAKRISSSLSTLLSSLHDGFAKFIHKPIV